MSSAAVHRIAEQAERRADRPRVLVLRSCRPPQFAAAVEVAKRRLPEAEIVALSHAGHHESLQSSGVDRIIEVPGRRLGVFSLGLSRIRRLRRERFDEVVVPQMNPHPAGHGNLYRLAAALGPTRVIVFPAPYEPLVNERRGFLVHALRVTCLEGLAWFDRPVFVLALLAAAVCSPRRAARHGQRKRVLHVISSLGVGGAQRQLAELVNRTPADQYDVEVLVLGRHDGEFARQWLPREGVRVTYLTWWPRLASSVLEVRRHCVAGRYDIVHTWLFMANVIGVAGARLAGVPRVIASVRNLSLWKRTWYRQWWFRLADVLGSRAADVVTVNAEALTSDHARWARYPVSRIRVVPNGLDPSMFLLDSREARKPVRTAAGLPGGSVVVGTVGRLAPEKDHCTFLRMIRIVREVRTDVHAVIVGDGQLRQQLEATAVELGIDTAVTFLGERDDARRLMAGFDVFVLPSMIEGFPNVLLEAVFLGIPAIATRVGGSTDVLENPHDTFAAGDAETAAARVLEIIQQPDVAAADAAAARRRALTLFTADRTAGRWFALYQESQS
jgi:glycosyltransferase involved in cell wall biosynthesis